MAQFKFKDDFIDEVSAVKVATDAINKDFSLISTDGIDTLKTALRFVQEHYYIKLLLDEYKELLYRDIEDINLMIEETKTMDNAIAMSHKS